MNDMKCDICRHWLHGYLDNELDTVTATKVAGHLAACASCRTRYEEIKTLKAGLKEQVSYFEAPQGLMKDVLSKIPVSSEKHQPSWRQWFMPFSSALALAAAVFLYVVAPSGEALWVDDAVSDHVRSLMAEHLNDVASSDRHTVKPWFIGKLDFAPPVYDFTAQGYPLLGGRLDYLQHQTAAALSYRHNKHVINTFIMPAPEADSEPQVISQRGYNIISWRQNHMRILVVSDLNAAELKTFCEMFRKGA